jgi:NAD(P)-dependent dehydrogenase (short-subunit alcohol dehydrogenase family)
MVVEVVGPPGLRIPGAAPSAMPDCSKLAMCPACAAKARMPQVRSRGIGKPRPEMRDHKAKSEVAPGPHPRPMQPIKRVAVITGAAQGIGRRTAEVLAGYGYDLVLNDLRPAKETAAAIEKSGGTCFEVLGDISRESEVQRIAESVQERYGRADVLVNNAGISFICPAEDLATKDWQKVLDVNLTGPFLLCRHFGKRMLEQGQGSIVNVSSIAGLAGIADRAAYNASKHGLIGLTRTLAAEWGGRGVRSNAVCPGWVKTEMDVADQAAGSYSDADIENRVPMGRFASAHDIAEAIAFLADPKKSAFVNGQTLAVDGGWLADGSWESLRLKHRPQP